MDFFSILIEQLALPKRHSLAWCDAAATGRGAAWWRLCSVVCKRQ